VILGTLVLLEFSKIKFNASIFTMSHAFALVRKLLIRKLLNNKSLPQISDQLLPIYFK